MKPEVKKRIQIFLVAVFVLATARLAWIWNERREANAPPPPKVEGKLPADYYVVPHKTYAYDLASLRKAIVGKTVWVRDGYRWNYYPHDAADHRTDMKHPAGLLGPIEALDITDVATAPSPDRAGEKQVLAVFKKGGKGFAFAVGASDASQTKIYVDEIVYIDDPRRLYQHWSADTWDAIAHHQVKPGMNQLQASFAIGVGYPEPGEMNNRAVKYPNGGQPLEVTYQDDRAVQIAPGRM